MKPLIIWSMIKWRLLVSLILWVHGIIFHIIRVLWVRFSPLYKISIDDVAEFKRMYNYLQINRITFLLKG